MALDPDQLPDPYSMKSLAGLAWPVLLILVALLLLALGHRVAALVVLAVAAIPPLGIVVVDRLRRG